MVAINKPSSYWRCPRCGEGPLFAGFGDVREHCDACGLELKSREPDTWLFMYVSTAFITGLFIIGLLWVFPVPANKWLARLCIGSAAIVAFFGTAPLRKGLAIAFDFWIDSRSNDHRG